MAATIFASTVALVALLASPTLAKQTDPGNADEKPAASACTAYQPQPDGSWKPLPCEEGAAGGHPRPNPAARSAESHKR